MAEGCSQSPTMESLDLSGMETSVSESLSDKSMTSSTEVKKTEAMEDVTVNQYDSDSSLDDRVYNAIIDRNCNLHAFNQTLSTEQIDQLQLFDKKTSYTSQTHSNTTFSTEQIYSKKISSTQKIQSKKKDFTKQQHQKTSSTDQFYGNLEQQQQKQHGHHREQSSSTNDCIIFAQNSISVSEDSRTMEEETNGKPGNDSLDEISSGEMGDPSEEKDNHLSCTMSDFWDEEEYLSEYNYNESLDEDNARKFLNFGDDYRNFIGSMSEDQSSINANDAVAHTSKNTKRRNRKKMISGKNLLDSQSEAEIENVCNVIEASQKEIISANNFSKEVFADGFLKKEQSQEYNELMETCSENLKLLIHLLQSINFDNSFVSKKKSREIRALLNQWERLLGKIKDNCEKTGIYESLKDDICTLRKDILTLIETTDNIDGQDNEANLETKLHMFKDAMMELSSFKSRLFQMNLSVHNFLAVLSNSHPLDQMQMDRAIGLKHNVVELYSLWDQSHHRTLGCISQTEISLRKLDDFQKELLDLTNQLRQDSQNLRKQKRQRRVEKKSRNSSSDSGISDASGGFSDSDISQREQQLTKLRMMANNLQVNLSPNSSALALISQTIETTSCQMKDLHKSYLKFKKGKKKLKPGLPSNSATNEKKLVHKQEFGGRSVRGRVVRMALAIQMVLMLVVFISWLCQPTCCDSYNSMSFTPQLRYIDGPPPI